MFRAILPAMLLAAAPAAAQTAQFQDTALLDTAVAQFTGKAIGEEGGARTAIDKRLKLAACAMPQLDWRGSFHDAVIVRCMSPVWRIFVPVNVARPAPAPAAVGTTSAARVPAAKPVKIIKRNDPVTIEAGSDGFKITRDGIAMGDAAAGERLQVRVEQGKPPIQAIAVEPGRVTLPGWAE
ncbi:flagella basal body P-ring formation protein FlgA [Stakelama marina]|uniref:Flagella basal body P-ring formation protein FlgA n=1 Tax=Stakelama marina TaxID=2826939 RepID=A0A8T4IEY7_9SPHN|nr:flagella basal body P-ring formation protein FlgA [Stakelama marina]MBR0553120.1 flagella basal body P-ring formation protein FlgA [Stakelama marina]